MYLSAQRRVFRRASNLPSQALSIISNRIFTLTLNLFTFIYQSNELPERQLLPPREHGLSRLSVFSRDLFLVCSSLRPALRNDICARQLRSHAVPSGSRFSPSRGSSHSKVMVSSTGLGNCPSLLIFLKGMLPVPPNQHSRHLPGPLSDSELRALQMRQVLCLH